MTAQAFCASCGAPLAVGASFCASCGKAIAGAPPPRASLGRTLATAVIVMIAAFLVGAILPFQGGQLLAIAVGALIAAAYIVVASRR